MTGQFQIRPTEAGKRRRRRVRWAIALTAVLALIAGIVSAIGLDQRNDRRKLEAARLCPGLAEEATDDYALSRPGGRHGAQCLGWTVTADYPFDSGDAAVAALVRTIVAENVAVREQAATRGSEAKPYVRIALMMPMTTSTGGAMANTEILSALRGVAVAQFTANHSGAVRDTVPLVQIVLANTGVDQSGYSPLGSGNAPDADHRWPGVAAQLAALADDRQHPLVAVTGMGISVPATKDAARSLAGKNIPVIGSVITSDDMTGHNFFKVSPSNRQYADALRQWLRSARQGGADLKNAMLVYDRNREDNYVTTLRQSFLDVFDGDYHLKDHQRGFTGSKPPSDGTPQLFSSIVDDICASDPEVVFYSGRDRDLRPFITALADRGRCDPNLPPLLVVTGATGLTLTDQEANAARIGIVNASSTDIAGWQRGLPGTPRAYRAFADRFTKPAPAGLGFPATDLNSGYAVMHHDAVIAGIWATRLWLSDVENQPGSNTPQVPTAESVLNSLFSMSSRRVPAASGELFFVEGDSDDRWPRNKPVPIIYVGNIATAWRSSSLYLTK